MKRFVAQIQALVRELRRRRVIRVTVVYAGTALVILQLGEIVVEPSGFPSGWLGPGPARAVLVFPVSLRATASFRAG